MPSENMHSSHLAHQPGETATESGDVAPTPRPTTRGPMSLEDVQLSSSGGELSTNSAYDKFVLGGEKEESSTETHAQVLEHVTAELDTHGNEIKSLREENVALKEALDILKRQVAELRGEKMLAADQPRRVRKQNGVTERLEKYEDGTFGWAVIRVDEVEKDTKSAEATPSFGDTWKDVSSSFGDKEPASEPAKAPEAPEASEPAEVPEIPEANEPAITPESAQTDEPAKAPETTEASEPAKAPVPKPQPPKGATVTPAGSVSRVSVLPAKDEEPKEFTPDGKPIVEAASYHHGRRVSIAHAKERVGAEPLLTIVDAETREVQVVPESEVKGKEIVVYEGEIEPEEAKKWWQKAGDTLRRYGGAAYWKDRFGRAESTPDDSLNRGIVESTPPGERDKHRKRNRYVALLATAALLAPTFLMGAVSGKSGSVGERDEAGASNSASPNPGEDAEREAAEAEAAAAAEDAATEKAEASKVINLPIVGAETTGPTTIPPAPELSDEQMTVEPGQGGYEYFQKIGLDANTWDANANALADQFPEDFYRENGDVRLMRSGQLSPEATEYIKSLRQG